MIKQAAFFGAVIGLAAAAPSFYQANKAEIRSYFASSPPVQVRTAQPQLNSRSGSSSSGRSEIIPMDVRGHFNADFSVNGRRVNMMVDTGATLVAINTSTARRIGLKLQPSDFKYDVDTANGKTKAAAGYIDEIAIGRVRVRNVPALIMRDSALSGALLGMSFLKELDSFKVTDRELILDQ